MPYQPLKLKNFTSTPTNPLSFALIPFVLILLPFIIAPGSPSVPGGRASVYLLSAVCLAGAGFLQVSPEKMEIFLTDSAFPAAARLKWRCLTNAVRSSAILAAAGKTEPVRNIPFLRPNQQKPRHGQTDGRQETNRSRGLRGRTGSRRPTTNRGCWRSAYTRYR